MESLLWSFLPPPKSELFLLYYDVEILVRILRVRMQSYGQWKNYNLSMKFVLVLISYGQEVDSDILLVLTLNQLAVK